MHASLPLNYQPTSSPSAYTPICFSNDQFRFCFDDIAAMAKLYNIPLWLYGGANYKKKPEDMDFSLTLITKKNMDELDDYLKLSTLPLENITPENKHQLDYLFQYSPTSRLIQFIQMLLNNGAHLDRFYFNKMDGYTIRIIQNGIPNEIVLTKKNLQEHANGLDLSVGVMYYSVLSDTSYIPYPESLEDFEKNELNFLPKDKDTLIGELVEDPCRISRAARASSSSRVLISNTLEQFLTSHIETQKNIFKYQLKNSKDTSKLSNRLYYDLQLSFFSGRAEATLEKMHQLNLFEQLFGFVKGLPKEAKDRTLYLIQKIAKIIDQDPTKYSPSLVYYAVHWETIKDRPFPVDDICGISKPMIRLHDDDLSNFRDAENRQILERLEREYERTFFHTPVNEDDLIEKSSSKHFSPVRDSDTSVKSPHDAWPILGEFTPDPSPNKINHSFSPSLSSSPNSAQLIEPVNTKQKKSKGKKKPNTPQETIPPKPEVKVPAPASPPEKNAAFYFEKAKIQQKEAEHLKKMAIAEHRQMLVDEALNKYNAARKYYLQAREKDPTDTSISTPLSALEVDILALPELRLSLQEKIKPKKTTSEKTKKSQSSKKVAQKYHEDLNFFIPESVTSTKDAEWWFQKGQEEFEAGEYQNAADAYSKSISDFPSHAKILQAYRGRMLANKELNQHQRIIDDANFLIDIKKSTYHKIYRSTQQKPYDLYEYHRAQAIFQRAKARSALGIEKIETSEDFLSVIQEAQKQAHEHPKNTDFHLIAAHSCFNIGISAKNSAQIIRREFNFRADSAKKIRVEKLEKIALERFKECIQWKPDFHEVYITLGGMLQKQGDIMEAFLYYKLCLFQLQENFLLADASQKQKNDMYNLIIRLGENLVGTLIDNLLDDSPEKKLPLAFRQLDKTQKTNLLNIGKSFYIEAQKYDVQEDEVGETESLEVPIRLQEIEDCIKKINEEKEASFYFDLAEEYKKANDFQNAADNYNVVITLEPNCWLAHRYRIDANYFQKKYDLALIQCDDVIELTKKTYDESSNEYKTEYYFTLYQRARNLLARKKEDDIANAMADFSAVMTEYITSDNPQLRIMASLSALQLGKLFYENVHALKDELKNKTVELSEEEEMERFFTIKTLEINAEEILKRSLEFDENCQEARIELDKINLQHTTYCEREIDWFYGKGFEMKKDYRAAAKQYALVLREKSTYSDDIRLPESEYNILTQDAQISLDRVKEKIREEIRSNILAAVPSAADATAPKGTASLIGRLGAFSIYSDRKPEDKTIVSIDISTVTVKK